MLVPRPLCSLSALTSQTPPLSDTVGSSRPRASYPTRFHRSRRSGTYFNALITSSVTIRPRLTASLEPPTRGRLHLDRDRPTVTDHRLCKAVAQLGSRARSRCSRSIPRPAAAVALWPPMTRWGPYRCRRSPRIGPRLKQKNACGDLKAVGDAMLHLLQQDFLSQ
jgi:hypothetical protein